MADADVSSNNSTKIFPEDYSGFMSGVEGRLWVIASQLKAANALLREQGEVYDESAPFVAVGFMLSDMEQAVERLVDKLDEGGSVYGTSNLKRRVAKCVQ